MTLKRNKDTTLDQNTHCLVGVAPSFESTCANLWILKLSSCDYYDNPQRLPTISGKSWLWTYGTTYREQTSRRHDCHVYQTQPKPANPGPLRTERAVLKTLCLNQEKNEKYWKVLKSIEKYWKVLKSIEKPFLWKLGDSTWEVYLPTRPRVEMRKRQEQETRRKPPAVATTAATKTRRRRRRRLRRFSIF